MFKSWTWTPLEGLVPSKRGSGESPRPCRQVRIQWEVSHPERTLTPPCQPCHLTLPASWPGSHNLMAPFMSCSVSGTLSYQPNGLRQVTRQMQHPACFLSHSLSLSHSFGRSQLTDCELCCGEAYQEWLVIKAFRPTTLKELDPASRPGREPEGQPFSLHSRWLQPRGTHWTRGT